MIVQKTTFQNMLVAFSSAFNGKFKAVKSKYEKIALVVPSTTKANSYPWLGWSTQVREWVGDRVMQALNVYQWTVPNKQYENSVAIKATDVEDDEFGLYTPVFEQMGQTCARFPDKLVFDTLAQGFKKLCYDGQNFFDTDHPVVVGEGVSITVSNTLTPNGTDEPWFLVCSSEVLKPLILQIRKKFALTRKTGPEAEENFKRGMLEFGYDGRMAVAYGLWHLAFGSRAPLTVANYETAIKALKNMVGDNGVLFELEPDLLIVGPENQAAAQAIVSADKLASGASNVHYKSAELMVIANLKSRADA